MPPICNNLAISFIRNAKLTDEGVGRELCDKRRLAIECFASMLRSMIDDHEALQVRQLPHVVAAGQTAHQGPVGPARLQATPGDGALQNWVSHAVPQLQALLSRPLRLLRALRGEAEEPVEAHHA